MQPQAQAVLDCLAVGRDIPIAANFVYKSKPWERQSLAKRQSPGKGHKKDGHWRCAWLGWWSCPRGQKRTSSSRSPKKPIPPCKAHWGNCAQWQRGKWPQAWEQQGGCQEEGHQNGRGRRRRWLGKGLGSWLGRPIWVKLEPWQKLWVVMGRVGWPVMGRPVGRWPMVF